jgi:hypothetical protein
VRLTTSHLKNHYCYENQKKPNWEATFNGGQVSYRVVEPMMMIIDDELGIIVSHSLSCKILSNCVVVELEISIWLITKSEYGHDYET